MLHVIAQRVRETVLRLLLVEQSSRIAVQLALLVTNISRFDFPSHWPNLLSELAGACMPDSAVPLPGRERAMLALKHVLRALRSKRIVVETPRPNSGQMSPQGSLMQDSMWYHSKDKHAVMLWVLKTTKGISR